MRGLLVGIDLCTDFFCNAADDDEVARWLQGLIAEDEPKSLKG